MKQKIALLIGATAGIGRETARLLAKEKYQVIVVGRNQTAGDQLARELNGQFIQADMSLMTETHRVAQRIHALTDTLDLIVHSADVLRIKRLETAEGMEVSIATNYYSRFLLNNLLINGPSGYRPARIIHIAAAGFPPGKTFKTKFPLAADASSFTSHGVGQITNDFYGLALADKLREQGTKVNILNPGMVDTDIRRQGDFPRWLKVLEPVFGLLLKPFVTRPEQYAQIVLAIATGRNADADQSVLINSKGKPVKPSAPLLDKELQQYVWTQTEQLISLTTKTG